MTNSRRRTLILALVLIFAFVLVWTLTYPSDNDPKNIKYVLWKNGLYPMNPDTAMGTMIGDAGRDKLVIGKTKNQLQKSLAVSQHRLMPITT